MLMTPNRPEAKSVTPQGFDLLAIIRQAGAGGISRKELAAKLNKKRLNVWDVALLEKLVSEGLADVQMRPNAERQHIAEHVYTAKDR